VTETFKYLMLGFVQVLQPLNIIWLIIGSVLGTVLGMLPGIGPTTGIALMLPLTFVMDPLTALLTMCAIYYGAMFGGSRSSILLNIPGDGAAIAACFDGYPMAKSGKAESALAISAIASFFGGLIATIAFVFLALPVSQFALRFRPPEYFVLMVFALIVTAASSKGDLFKGLLSIVFGLMFATVGIELQSGVERMTFGIAELQSGIDFIVVIVGVFGLGEVFTNLESLNRQSLKPIQTKFKKIWITMEEWKRSIGPILRATPVGFLVGVLPGAGGTIASLMAYNNEKQISKEPDKFGKGAIEGLAAPEAANNAASVGALIPMMTMGIPGSGTTAIMLGALIMMGLQPGPLLFTQHPALVWGVIASMFLGNIVCAIVNIPMASLLVRVLAIKPTILYPLVLVMAFMGVYTVNFSTGDFVLMIMFGVIGYFMKKYKVPTGPMILAVIVGPMMEQSFSQSMKMTSSCNNIFFSSYICIGLWILTVLSIAYPYIATGIKKLRTIDI
jgi:putative tricarboxylic transport membrane protein